MRGGIEINLDKDTYFEAGDNITPWNSVMQWLTGNGTNMFFGPEHCMTKDMQGSPKLRKALDKYKKEKHKVGDASFVEVDSFMPFGEGMANSTRQVVGSFTTSVYQLEDKKIGVLLYNNMSPRSAFYHIVPNGVGEEFHYLKQWYYFEEDY